MRKLFVTRPCMCLRYTPYMSFLPCSSVCPSHSLLHKLNKLWLQLTSTFQLRKALLLSLHYWLPYLRCWMRTSQLLPASCKMLLK